VKNLSEIDIPAVDSQKVATKPRQKYRQHKNSYIANIVNNGNSLAECAAVKSCVVLNSVCHVVV